MRSQVLLESPESNVSEVFKVRVENVVATANLKQNLDLHAISRVFHQAEYKPQHFPGVIFRASRLRVTALIFSSGRMVCTGGRSSNQSRRSIVRIVDELKRAGIVIVARPEITIQNVVASGELCVRIDLEDAAMKLKRTVYEPEQFPGLIYRMDKPQVVILLFATGKFVCTGARSEEDVKQSVIRLHDDLKMANVID